jgi:UDPglucose 6-dehydrogenase
LEQGAEVYAYDPVGMEHFKKKFPEDRYNITYVDNPDAALKEANVCFIFTEWNEIKEVKPEQYKGLMRTPLVFDGRNIYDVAEMKKAGVEYYSIGRKESPLKNGHLK